MAGKGFSLSTLFFPAAQGRCGWLVRTCTRGFIILSGILVRLEEEYHRRSGEYVIDAMRYAAKYLSQQWKEAEHALCINNDPWALVTVTPTAKIRGLNAQNYADQNHASLSVHTMGCIGMSMLSPLNYGRLCR